MDPLIFHVDVNSAYLSWEAARRVANGETDLRRIPSAVGGDRQKRTGVILAKSIPAKKYNIKTGEPVAMALRKCPQLVLVKPDFRLYERNSKAFMDLCRRYAPVVEKYSIDECFLDMTGTHMLYPDPVQIATRIKNEIRDTLGFTVNVGIGSNKLLAKMASDFEKPDKVHTLFDWEIPAKLWPLPVDDLFTVGGATAQRLKKAYILTIGDLAKTELGKLQTIVGKKWGQQLHDYANGISHSPVRSQPEEVKGYSNSITLEQDVTSVETANQILLALAESVASRIRSGRDKALCISVTIRGNDFKDRSHQKKLAEPTDITAEIYQVAKQLFAELWDRRTPLRLLGISLTNLTKEDFAQQTLFSKHTRDRERKLDMAVDRLRDKFGIDTISRGALLHSDLAVGKKFRSPSGKKREK